MLLAVITCALNQNGFSFYVVRPVGSENYVRTSVAHLDIASAVSRLDRPSDAGSCRY